MPVCVSGPACQPTARFAACARAGLRDAALSYSVRTRHHPDRDNEFFFADPARARWRPWRLRANDLARYVLQQPEQVPAVAHADTRFARFFANGGREKNPSDISLFVRGCVVA